MDLVLKRKSAMKTTCSHKRNEAKQAYGAMTTNKEKAHTSEIGCKMNSFCHQNIAHKSQTKVRKTKKPTEQTLVSKNERGRTKNEPSK